MISEPVTPRAVDKLMATGKYSELDELLENASPRSRSPQPKAAVPARPPNYLTRELGEYAIKILDKNHLTRKEKMLVALAGKNVLVRLGAGHPGIIHLHWTFQDEWSLFFVLDLAPNGEMQSRISRLGSLSLPCSRYYAAQIVDALQYMDGKDIIHRWVLKQTTRGERGGHRDPDTF
ncbi:hypothetical protein AZE42_12019 [Rhizopogon vesiculosus]|uniref:non-specific serine/threonine protein kinase n=1 Tax=Rhizopogon vesiculosus TaxID=180088 RepID=A0A1J8Q6N4_9AGAM|nr:hypothetical protein AZE42_12019 [Rhizopogon vesiculosus]